MSKGTVIMKDHTLEVHIELGVLGMNETISGWRLGIVDCQYGNVLLNNVNGVV
jgi:hypothetical protein